MAGSKKFFQRFICLITSLVCFIFSAVAVPASAEITFEQEIMIYLNSQSYDNSMPYTPDYFQNLVGWSTCSEDWNSFIENSNYDNRLYLTYTQDTSSGLRKFYRILNYDSIVSFSNSTRKIVFNNLTMIYFSTSFSGSGENVYETVNSTLYVYDSTSTESNRTFQIDTYVSYEHYYAFSVYGNALILENGKILYESLDEDKGIGIGQGIKKLLSGDFSLMDNSLVDVEEFQLLGSLFNGDLTNSLSVGLGVDVAIGSDIYNEIVTDLTNNTKTSQVWNSLDNSTTSSIEKTYNNLKNTLDNSLRVYTDSDNNYYYRADNSTSTTSTTSAPNYIDYITNNEGDTNTYYTTYVYDYGSSSGGDVTTTPSGGNSGGNSGGSGNGGAYAYASAQAQGGNAEINQGDIVINVPSSSGSSGDVSGDVTSVAGTASESESDVTTSTVTDVDISTFEELLDSCDNFIVFVTNVLKRFPSELTSCIVSLFAVVLVCRILGR